MELKNIHNLERLKMSIELLSCFFFTKERYNTKWPGNIYISIILNALKIWNGRMYCVSFSSAARHGFSKACFCKLLPLLWLYKKNSSGNKIIIIQSKRGSNIEIPDLYKKSTTQLDDVNKPANSVRFELTCHEFPTNFFP